MGFSEAAREDGEVEESHQQQPELEGPPQRHQAPASPEGHRREGHVPEVPSQPAFRQEEQRQEAVEGDLRDRSHSSRGGATRQVEGMGCWSAANAAVFVHLQTPFWGGAQYISGGACRLGDSEHACRSAALTYPSY